MRCEVEKKLCAFDPFAGVGGFGLGLAEGCSMQTRLGVEINPSAAETMRFDIIHELRLSSDQHYVMKKKLLIRYHCSYC
jgi:site-specific DNA-cytosine methylase